MLSVNGLARTVALPTRAGAAWDFEWDAKRPADDLDYTLDCSAWLADAGRILQSAAVYSTSNITVLKVGYAISGNVTTGVTLQLVGGTPLETAQVRIVLMLDSGRELSALVNLPILDNFPATLALYSPGGSTTPVQPAGGADATGSVLGLLGLTTPAAAAP